MLAVGGACRRVHMRPGQARRQEATRLRKAVSMQGSQGMRRLEAIFGLVAAVAGCAVTAALAAAISSGALPADKPGALFFQAVGFTAFLAIGLGALLHAAET